jgi:hypothetical protein
MSPTTDTGTRPASRARTDGDRDREVVVYEAGESRRSFATSELWIYVIVTAAMVIMTYANNGDSLSHDDGWRYATALTIGYLISRGLAKAGTSEPRERSRHL